MTHPKKGPPISEIGIRSFWPAISQDTGTRLAAMLDSDGNVLPHPTLSPKEGYIRALTLDILSVQSVYG